MLKGMYFSLPSLGVAKTMAPVVEGLARTHRMLYYNAEAFRPPAGTAYAYVPYPAYAGGYQSHTLAGDIQYFRFGELLMDTAGSLLDFLVAEVEREKPDFILHSHLAVWGKLVARYFDIPAIALFNTFVMDEKSMLPQVGKPNGRYGVNFNTIQDGKNFFKKACAVYNRLGFSDKSAIWEVYTNKEKLNLAFILEAFQPRRDALGPEFEFVGYPLPVADEAPREPLVYVALGTIFNQQEDFYRNCIDALKRIPCQCILSVGTRVNVADLGALPAHVRVERFVDQVEVLKQATVFVTQGGMSSVHEALYTGTPMVVIPRIQEQKVTARTIADLHLGVHVADDDVTADTIGNAVRHVLLNNDYYVRNLKRLLAQAPPVPAADLSARLIDAYLNKARAGLLA